MGSTGSTLSKNERMAILESARAEVKLNKLDTLMVQNLMVTTSPALIEQMQDLRMKSPVEAIRKDAVAEVQRALSEGKVQIGQEFGPLKVTLLHMAVYYGSVATIQCLLKQPGTQVNASTSEGDTPIVLAVLSSESDLQALKLVHLLIQDSRVSIFNKNPSKLPAFAALKKDYVDTAKFLVSSRFLPNYSLEQLVVLCKMALRFHHDDVLQLILTGVKGDKLEPIITQVRPKTPLEDIAKSLSALSIDPNVNTDKMAPKNSEDPSEKWSEDAGDNKLRVGNHVQTLSKETIKRFLPPTSRDSDIAKIAGQKAIVHNIIGESLYIELVDANCMAAINSRAVIFTGKGHCCRLADESFATVGSFVRVIDNEDTVKGIQGDSKWRHGMEETCGRTGRVVRFSDAESAQVQFAWGCRFFYHPKALLASNEDNIESQDSHSQWFRMESAVMVEPNPSKFKTLQEEIGLQTEPSILGKLVQVDRISIKPFSGQKIVRVLGNGKAFSVNSQALQVVTQELDSAGNRISKGDSVKLRPDASKTLKILQTTAYGGFVERMLQLGNVQGTVENIVLDGRYSAESAVIKVRFTTQALYHLNPKAVVLLERSTGKAGASKGQLEVIKRTQLKVMEKLGEGGFGSVFKGTWTKENGKVKTVAVKQMNYGVTSSNVFEDILKEAKTQFALNHPNVISIYGISYGPQQDLWLVMKLVEGKDLNSILFPSLGEKKFELPFKYKVKICMDVAYAIAFVHDKGYLHADIKPNNMMVNMRTGRVYLCDFGITRYLGNLDIHTYATNFTDNFGGTLLYVAPECLKQDKDKRYLRPTFKSDVWSLGASFYEIFTEKYLFDDGMVCMKCKLQNDSEYVQKLVNFNVPQEVRTIIKKMLDFLPSRRPNVYELTDLLHSL